MNMNELKEGDIIGVIPELMGEPVVMLMMKCNECGELFACPQQEGMPMIKAFNYVSKVLEVRCRWCSHPDDCGDPDCRIHAAKQGIPPPKKDAPIDVRKN